MMADESEVMIGEDVLSTYYSTTSNSDSSSGSAPLTTSTTSASSSNSSTNRHEPGLLNFFRRRSWFGFGGAAEYAKKKEDVDTIQEIIKCYQNNDVPGMEKFVHEETKITVCETEKWKDGEGMWWDDEEVLRPKRVEENLKEVPFGKNTPHPKKGVSMLPPRVLKAVRFDVENTPEDRENRPFTPLFTSTPKHFGTECDSDDELRPLRECDSNTVLLPVAVHNNTSSILLASTSVMTSLNKCHQETTDALCLPFNKNIYKICYDDTDEEEVAEEALPSETPTPSRGTFVVEMEGSEPSSKTMSGRDQSFDQLDISTDSSVILNLDCIDNYIQRLDDEIAAANRFAREKDMVRAMGAVQQARLLQERFEQMNDAINEMCSKLPDDFECPNAVEDDKSYHDLSAVFEDSQWGARLGSEAGSFNGSQL